MAGRIRDEDVELVKERADLAAVIGDHVTLRSAGGGNLKGLCPFHDEKTPSFSVRPSVGRYHCFGCEESGDVITFVQRMDHLGFAEAVERLASRTGIQLRYEEGGYTPGRQQGQRTRLAAAHRAAAEFYAELLTSPEAAPGREFLAGRGFDRAAAETFGVGYAPRADDALVQHLRGRGFTDEELRTGGLARDGRRGVADRFTGRLLWPIRDITGDVVGFGARRLYDDDFMQAKYLNTPETPLYRKSTVLYGVDLAKREIARRMQAVVVEGYTDVMACHLADVGTAIATCGTAFGAEHVKVLRRLLMDQNEFRGEVVFTFDGDEAGQKAALRAFNLDQRFVTQTYVAVEPSGLDPCDLRLQHGDAAVRDLVARRSPLFEFHIRTLIRRYDLDTIEGTVAARRAGMDVVRRISDVASRGYYARQLASWLGVDPDDLVREAGGGLSQAARRRVPQGRAAAPDDLALRVERAVLKVALQQPQLAGDAFDVLEPEVFTTPLHAAVRDAVAAAGGVVTADPGRAWVTGVLDACPDDEVRRVVTALSVEPLDGPADARYTGALVARVEELATTRRITSVKARLERLNPVGETESYNRLYGELIALEAHRRGLRDRAMGAL